MLEGSHPGQMLAVHCHHGVLEKDVHSGDSSRGPLCADPDVHNHTEPVLSSLITQRCHFKCTLCFYCSRQAIKGAQRAIMADGAVGLFDVTSPDPMSHTADLLTGTRQLLTLYQARSLARTRGLAVFVHQSLAHLEDKSVLLKLCHSGEAYTFYLCFSCETRRY